MFFLPRQQNASEEFYQHIPITATQFLDINKIVINLIK